jgi:hypothetical protein
MITNMNKRSVTIIKEQLYHQLLRLIRAEFTTRIEKTVLDQTKFERINRDEIESLYTHEMVNCLSDNDIRRGHLNNTPSEISLNILTWMSSLIEDTTLKPDKKGDNHLKVIFQRLTAVLTSDEELISSLNTRIVLAYRDAGLPLREPGIDKQEFGALSMIVQTSTHNLNVEIARLSTWETTALAAAVIQATNKPRLDDKYKLHDKNTLRQQDDAGEQEELVNKHVETSPD